MEPASSTDAASGAQPFQAPAFEAGGQLPATPDGPRPNIELILDVPVTLSLEVGRTQMSVGRLLRLTQGSVVELDRNAGDALDVFVNGTLVARGEIVIVNDRFGIRLTDVLPGAARRSVAGG
jgi:flagellar motor switch protein FliN/FliY